MLGSKYVEHRAVVLFKNEEKLKSRSAVMARLLQKCILFWKLHAINISVTIVVVDDDRLQTSSPSLSLARFLPLSVSLANWRPVGHVVLCSLLLRMRDMNASTSISVVAAPKGTQSLCSTAGQSNTNSEVLWLCRTSWLCVFMLFFVFSFGIVWPVEIICSTPQTVRQLQPVCWLVSFLHSEKTAARSFFV